MGLAVGQHRRIAWHRYDSVRDDVQAVPDAYISWNVVWVGAVVTAVLFTLGKLLIGLYLGRSSFTSVYGAAGSVVLILAWVYYSSLILFLGAEFTRVYADQYGRGIVPKPNAVPMDTRTVCGAGP